MLQTLHYQSLVEVNQANLAWSFKIISLSISSSLTKKNLLSYIEKFQSLLVWNTLVIVFEMGVYYTCWLNEDLDFHKSLKYTYKAKIL